MGKPLILVVDDSAVVRHVVRTTLESEGHTVMEASDGESGLTAAQQSPPTVILLDVELPGLGGLDVLDRLRADRTLSAVPVILLTGRSTITEVVGGLSRGAHDYLTKPFEPAELAARVGAAVRAVDLLDLLHRRNAELDRFSAKAAHDLKSPLTVIKGSADILRIGWERLDADTRSEQLAAISRAAQKAATMVDDLLALARYDADEQGAPGTTDLRSAIDGIVAAAELSPDERVTIDGQFGVVRVPQADVTAIFGNLLENARHYGRSLSGELEVTITGRVTEQHVIVEVADCGTGIPEGELSRIFDAFYRLPGSRDINPSSTGVGLSIVQRALARWGGRVSVRNASPGAAFEVLLPPG